ncbi:MAG: hypothetical protein ACK5E3_07570 [Planctomycetota bacterium]
MPQRIRTRTGPWVDGYRADSLRRFVAQRADISVASTGSPTHMPQRIRMRTGPWVDGYRADSLRRFVTQRADIRVFRNFNRCSPLLFVLEERASSTKKTKRATSKP